MLVYWLDILGTAVFAISGVLLAGKLRMDPFGVLVLGASALVQAAPPDQRGDDRGGPQGQHEQRGDDHHGPQDNHRGGPPQDFGPVRQIIHDNHGQFGRGTPPPPNVPKLKEASATPSNMREMLKQHSMDRACAVCHQRIDPLGFALENFDPIGRFRTQDDNGAKIDDSAEYKDGTKFAGIDGLRKFLHDRQNLLDAQLSRKLTGYALGRQTLATDKPLMKKIQDDLKAGGGRFSIAVLDLINSRQFLNRRGEHPVASN